MHASTLRRLVTLAVSLFCLCLARGAMAQDAQLLLAARTTQEPGAFVWVDTPEGLGISTEAAQAIRTQFAGTDWGFFDNNQLIIGKDAQPILIAFYVANSDSTFFIIHRRTRTFSIDGTAFRDAATKEGLADLFITTFAEDGNSSQTAYLSFRLSFVR